MRMTCRSFSLLCAALLMALTTPASSHNDHNEAAEAAEAANAAGNRANLPAGVVHEMAGHHHEAEEARPTTFSGRLFAWLGHMHPFAVHFPIVLFPISWIALIIARRR